MRGKRGAFLCAHRPGGVLKYHTEGAVGGLEGYVGAPRVLALRGVEAITTPWGIILERVGG